MNPRPAAARLLDGRACRLLFALPAALALWGAMLLGLEHAMRPPLPDAPAPPPLAMQFVQIEQPPAMDEPAPAAAATPQAAPPPSPPMAPAQPADAAPAPRAVQARRPPQPVSRPAPRPARIQPAAPAPQAPSSTAPAPLQPAAPPASPGLAQDGPARPLAQPLPALPDDLRDRNLQAVALARFLIHEDGTAEVMLLRPTPNPRLNQLLLESLRQWRFAPAMKDGRTVQSSQDIRVHFTVD